MVSLEHTRFMLELGFRITFFTINPKSIDNNYSKQYLNFKNKYEDRIDFREISQNSKARYIYGIKPGESRDRWNIESLFYNGSLFSEIEKDSKKYDFMLSYFNLDALVVPTKKVVKNVLYLCGVPAEENEFRTSYLAMYDKVFAITEETKKYWGKYTSKHISVVPTGVDSERFKPEKQSHGKVNIVFIGRLIERKGCDVFIRAISKIPKKKLGNVRVQIIGDGPQKTNLLKLASTLSLEENIEFMGMIVNPESHLSLADICVFPSLAGEGLQGALLEAMASGAGVMASDSLINQKLLGDGRGVIINARDEGDLFVQIIRLIDDPNLTQDMGAKAREYVTMYYSWQEIVDQLVKEIV